MKKILLALAVATAPALLFAQICQRDSNLLITGDLLSPAPWSPDTPFYNLKPACIGEPYNQSVSINVPAMITVSGISLPISSISIATSGAIGNYPAGLNYSCDPPNCVFNANTLGCIQLYGTPSPANPAPDTTDLSISASVATPVGPIPTQFPGNQTTPNDHYYLIVRPAGQCAVSGTADPIGLFVKIRSLPNPFSLQTQVEVQTAQAGSYQFEVLDLFGRRLHRETVQLSEGANQFSYDGSSLPEGAYVFSLENATGRSAWRVAHIF